MEDAVMLSLIRAAYRFRDAAPTAENWPNFMNSARTRPAIA
jgi:hypothetical protein